MENVRHAVQSGASSTKTTSRYTASFACVCSSGQTMTSLKAMSDLERQIANLEALLSVLNRQMKEKPPVALNALDQFIK